MEHDEEKRALELAAVEAFLLIYNAQAEGEKGEAGARGARYYIKEHRDRPDFVLLDDLGRQMGLEVTHLFDSQQEARYFLHGIGDSGGPLTMGEVVTRLNDLLADKVDDAMDYDFPGPVSLLVRVASPIFDVGDFRREASRIHVPPGVYQHVWLLCRDDSAAWDQLMELR